MKSYNEFILEKFDYRKQGNVDKKLKSIFDIKKGDKVYYYDKDISKILTCTVDDIKIKGYYISLKCKMCTIEIWLKSKEFTPIEWCTIIDDTFGNNKSSFVSTSEDVLMDYLQVKDELTMWEFVRTLR